MATMAIVIPNHIDPQSTYSPKQLAKMLCISRKKVYDFINSGDIPVIAVGHQKRITADVVARILRTGIVTE